MLSHVYYWMNRDLLQGLKVTAPGCINSSTCNPQPQKMFLHDLNKQNVLIIELQRIYFFKPLNVYFFWVTIHLKLSVSKVETEVLQRSSGENSDARNLRNVWLSLSLKFRHMQTDLHHFHWTQCSTRCLFICYFSMWEAGNRKENRFSFNQLIYELMNRFCSMTEWI